MYTQVRHLLLSWRKWNSKSAGGVLHSRVRRAALQPIDLWLGQVVGRGLVGRSDDAAQFGGSPAFCLHGNQVFENAFLVRLHQVPRLDLDFDRRDLHDRKLFGVGQDELCAGPAFYHGLERFFGQDQALHEPMVHDHAHATLRLHIFGSVGRGLPAVRQVVVELPIEGADTLGRTVEVETVRRLHETGHLSLLGQVPRLGRKHAGLVAGLDSHALHHTLLEIGQGRWHDARFLLVEREHAAASHQEQGQGQHLHLHGSSCGIIHGFRIISHSKFHIGTVHPHTPLGK